MKQPTLRYLTLAILAALAGAAQAQDSPITISGFGTAALTMSDTDDAEYARFLQASGVKKKPRPGVDSNFGIQGTYKLNDQFSFTAQGLARKVATDKFGAELAWAFAKYKINDDFNLRVGRMGLPVYMISDFRNVGYANLMLRPPQEVYRQVSVDAVDGVDISFQHSYGDTTLTAQLAAGKSSTEAPGNFHVDFKDVLALNVVAENGPFTLRFGRAQTKFTYVGYTSLNGLLTTLRAVGLASVAAQMPITEVKGSFTSVGGTMDYKNFLVQAEYAKRKTDTRMTPDTSSWYTMFGYRIGKVTPYYVHSSVQQDSIRNFAGLPSSGPLAPLAAAANGAIKTGLQTSDAIGMRWDFYKSAALKVQFDHVKPKDGPGAFVNAKPGFTGPVNVYAAAIDFVF
ncbi:porin [Oxalobacteraceae bacterium]|nr:porin [Oxalobacteraceae bacterium]